MARLDHRITIRLPEEDMEKLRVLQAVTGWTISRITREVVRLRLLNPGTFRAYGEILQEVAHLEAQEQLAMLDALIEEIEDDASQA